MANLTYMKSLCLSLLGFLFCFSMLAQQRNQSPYKLIAHRGGVVDERTPENSLPALNRAIKEGYWMIEVDLRMSRDSVLFVHHDKNFNRFFNVDKKVNELEWPEISGLTSDVGTKVLTFEEVLQNSQGKIRLMIDNKIPGNDTILFSKVLRLMEQYDQLEEAYMIGREESTAYFTGKIKLSCTRQQIEENKKKPGYQAEHYYLFSDDIKRGDVRWAEKEGIPVVGVINAWSMSDQGKVMELAASKAEKLKAAGVRIYQIDSIFRELLK